MYIIQKKPKKTTPKLKLFPLYSTNINLLQYSVVLAQPLVLNTESLHTESEKITKKSPFAPESICEKTGLISGGVASARSARYQLQHISKQILKDQLQPNGKKYRVVNCLSSRVSKDTDVLILKGSNSDVCHFGNLQRCGSVWTCPVCAAAITQQRANEIVIAQEKHRKMGFVTLMITFTHSHKIHTKLSDTMEKLPLAFAAMRNSRQYKNLLKSNNYRGLIKALESTYSDNNGFHVHTHELFFFDKKHVNITEVKDILFKAWLAACVKVGLGAPSKKRGVVVKTSFSPSDYLSKFGFEQKWGSGAELTKSHSKKGHSKSLTMFDFLRLAQDGNDQERKKYSKLYQEFVHCFFGKRQLYWTNGLKKHFKIKEITDAEILENKQDDAEIVAVIKPKTWSYLKNLPFDARASLLRWAELGGVFAIDSYIAFLKTIYPPPS